MDVAVPDFPEDFFVPVLGEELTRSKSFDPSDTLTAYDKSPLFNHLPLQYEVPRDKYRTVAAERRDRDSEYTFPFIVERTLSSDHLYERYLGAKLGYKRDEKPSDRSTLSQDNVPTLVDKLDPEASPKPEETLCERCCRINIERLAEKDGYAHSNMEVLYESGVLCPLCDAIFGSLGSDRYRYASSRYTVRLSLATSKQEKDPLGLHSAPEPSRECIWVQINDTQPWLDSMESEESIFEYLEKDRHSSKPSQKERCVHGRRMSCYTEEGDPAADVGVPWRRKINGHTGSPLTLRVAKSWLKQCIMVDRLEKNPSDIEARDSTAEINSTNFTQAPETASSGFQGDQTEALNWDPDDVTQPHSDKHFVTSSFPTERPTRLVEIVKYSIHDPSPRIARLIETLGHDYPYAALSYCWGTTSGAWLTMQENINQSLDSIDIESLPATLKDAIHAAYMLDINYIWVDSLCIIQDSPSDWEIESAKMGGIYWGALLTIAVAKSFHSSQGCFNENNDHPYDPFAKYSCIENRLDDKRISRLYFNRRWLPDSSASYQREVDESPLASRGWTYQEQILSRRTLYFAQSQLYWACAHCRLSYDNAPQGGHNSIYCVLTSKQPLSTYRTIQTWYWGAVEAYSGRKLTKPTDKLVAISAIAKAIFLNRPVKYIAGLWEDSVMPGMCWYRDGPGKKNKLFSCPSWSWASQLSSVRYAHRANLKYTEDSHTLPKVLDIEVQASGKNPFGSVSAGSIKLLTRTTRGIVMRDRYKTYFSGFSRRLRGQQEKALLIPETNGWKIRGGGAILDDDAREVQVVVVALLSDWTQDLRKWIFLLLELVDDSRQEYKRVGLGGLDVDYGRKPNIERDWVERTLTLL